ncbi:ribonuclease H-like domain-containing protein [Halomarina salina]|uniref:Ribonuclease H-like domain-containing protein n=1 Tax=Halomarina salina TaxID=1872699 RepID=A0ABD5RPM4_9EURY|nr:ribonuclease H-like domain-containing protein [Halomarina salina]
MPRPATVLALPSALAGRLSPAELADLHAYADPDAVLVPDPVYAPGRFRPPGSDVPILTPEGEVHVLGDVTLAVCETLDHVRAVTSGAAFGEADDSGHTAFLASTLLSVETDPMALDTRLDGAAAYREALGDDDGEQRSPTVHLAGYVPADYRREWDGLDVQGVAPVETQGAPAVPVLALHPDGTVAVDEVRTDRLALRALSGVGDSRAAALSQAGYDRETLAETPPHELADLDGFGRSSAETAVRSARALERGELLRTGDAPLPADPVFLDIETDGLRPSVVWQVGVQYRDDYRSFLARDPDDAPAMLGGFLDWLSGVDGTLVAWNGWGFDFPVLDEHVEAHHPERRDVWRRASKCDLLQWARDEGNAVLPGRTNKLEAVAGALGYEGHGTGLTGAETARRYRAWMDGGPEPDWERHRNYCEDDVRMLAHVYDAIAATDRVESTVADRAATNQEGDTRQGSLSEF